MNARDELYDKVCMMCVGEGCSLENIKNQLYIILSAYEIEERCTEVAVLQQDRNESLLKKFIVAKMVKGCTDRTVKLYRIEIGKTLDKIGKTVDDITADDIRLYLARRINIDKVKKRTADNELRYLRSFFGWLRDEEIIKKNPVIKVDKIKCEKKAVETFTELEVEKLREGATDERIKCIVELLLSTGCRVTELVNIKIEEIEGNKILVHGKGNKDRTVYINAKAQLAMEKYMGMRKDNNPYLFPGGHYNNRMPYSRKWWLDKKLVDEAKHLNTGTVESVMRTLARSQGIDRANPHKFRKTCATMALKRGMPIEQVSKMLGHEQISTTQIYLSIDEEDMENNHKKYVV